MVDEQLHDRIENYLLGRLPKDAAARLEAEMAADEALADQVALQRLGLMGVQRLAATGMAAKFDAWDADLDAQPPAPPPPAPARNPWIWATGLLLLLLTAGALWFFMQGRRERNALEEQRRQAALRDSLLSVTEADYRKKAAELETLKSDPVKDSLSRQEIQRLQRELEQKDQTLRELEQRRPAGNKKFALQLAPPASRFRGAASDADPVLDAAKKAYEKPDYQEAVRLLKSIPPGDARQAQVTQLLPYALFYAGRFQEAIPAFMKLWEQDADNEAMNAQGYLLLCYIAEGKTLEAKQMRLVIMQNPKHKFYKTAESSGK